MDWSMNFGRPDSPLGRLLLYLMKRSHGAMSRWGLHHTAWRPDMAVLDVGCGRGGNLQRLLELCPQGQVAGIDISVESVRKSRERTAEAMGRCDVQLSSVEAIPSADNTYDVVTALGSHYFWPRPEHSLREMKRVLRPGGTVLIAAEFSDPECFWSRILRDLRICTPERLMEHLVQAGYEDVTLDTGSGQWICVTGKKR